MKKVMLVFGTRPEAIKMCPLVNELKKNDSIKTIVCVTGQHKEMLEQVLDVFKVVPDYDLGIMKTNQTLFSITTSILDKIQAVLEQEQPDIVLVHGDTTTTFATALAAFYMGIKVGHVEAGLRTYNLQSPFPEEFNRQTTSIIADYNHPILEWAKDSKLIMLTAHRRENLGQPMENMFNAVNRILNEFEDVKVVYPIHKNPKVRELASKVFGDNERMKIIEPLEVIDFHNFMNQSYMILTDSGGVQEEAPSLGKPVLVMRDTTERPEGIAAGTLKLVGTEEENIYTNFKLLLKDEAEYNKMSKASNPYGDGKACERIVDIILEG